MMPIVVEIVNTPMGMMARDEDGDWYFVTGSESGPVVTLSKRITFEVRTAPAKVDD